MKTLLEYIQEQHEYISSSCNGKHTCGKCKVYSPTLIVTPEEKKILSIQDIEKGYRLACFHEYHGEPYHLIEEDMDILDTYELEHTSINTSGCDVIMDIGTSTIVLQWISLETQEILHSEAFVNPQRSYGWDVISRIEYDGKYPGVLHQVLIQKIKEILNNVHIEFSKMIVCGNTTMIHLFLNESVQSLGRVPFTVPRKELVKISSKVLFPELQEFNIITLPHISAYVGADLVSGIIATNIDQSEEYTLLIDMGTNGEIVLGNRQHIYATSSPAGPAFEGAGISCGGPGVPGAIVKVSIKQDVDYKTIHNRKAHSICGSGLISLIAELRRNNYINELGRFKDHRKEFILTEDIKVNEKDIQTFILAKAALQAGITCLLEKVKVNRIVISGGFGSNIDVEDLVTIGLIPEEYVKKVSIGHNTALQGVYQYALHDFENRCNEIVNKSKYIDLSTDENFEDLLVDGLFLE